MKKVSLNGRLLKGAIHILVYIRLYVFLLSNIISEISNYSFSGMFYSLYDRFYFNYELGLAITLSIGLFILYMIVYTSLAFIRYLRLFYHQISDDIWVAKIINLNDDEESPDQNDSIKVKFESSKFLGEVEEEYLEKRNVRDPLNYYFRRSFLGLLILIVICVLVSFMSFFLG
jgi:hypothetical protein